MPLALSSNRGSVYSGRMKIEVPVTVNIQSQEKNAEISEFPQFADFNFNTSAS